MCAEGRLDARDYDQAMADYKEQRQSKDESSCKPFVDAYMKHYRYADSIFRKSMEHAVHGYSLPNLDEDSEPPQRLELDERDLDELQCTTLRLHRRYSRQGLIVRESTRHLEFIEETGENSVGGAVSSQASDGASHRAIPSTGVAAASKRTGVGAQRAEAELQRILELRERGRRSEKALKLLPVRQKLPSFARREALLEVLRARRILVVSGATGCGKTTQVPQFILDDALDRGMSDVQIFCTQPRRISAVGVATRVAEERGEEVGVSVGYQIRMKKVAGTKTLLTFCTTGILLRKMLDNPRLDGVTHVVLDEVHERNINSDFLLVILRDLLIVRPDLRVVLMSATLDADQFASYFEAMTKDKTLNDEQAAERIQKMLAKVLRCHNKAFAVGRHHMHDSDDDDDDDDDGDDDYLDDDDIDYGAYMDGDEEDWDRRREEIVKAEEHWLDELPISAAWAAKEARSGANLDGKSDLAREVPVVHVPGFMFDVEEFYLEDILETLHFDLNACLRELGLDTGRHRRVEGFGDYMSALNEGQLDHAFEDSSDRTLAGVKAFGAGQCGIVAPLVVKLCEHIHASDNDSARTKYGMGAILIFLPGQSDIEAVVKALELSRDQSGASWLILPLYGALPPEDQALVFDRPPVGVRKIVVATNIAESSVTVDDVMFVIDGGKHKEMTYDHTLQLSCLLPAWVSKASAKQRRGRAGRVRAGCCYRLYPRPLFEEMSDYAVPEIMRTPLEQLCLQVRGLKLARNGQGGIAHFLSKSLTAPCDIGVATAISKLHHIGALSVDESLTALGVQLAELPMDPCLGKGIIYAMLVFGCTDEILVLGALVSLGRSPFFEPFRDDEKRDARASHESFLCGTNSDHRAWLECYVAWSNRPMRERGSFAFTRFLNNRILGEAREMQRELRQTFGRARLVLGPPTALGARQVHERWPLVRAALAAGYMPSVARAKGKFAFNCPDVGTVKQARGSLAGQNRRAEKQRYSVYAKRIKALSGVFVYDMSPISPVVACLFGRGDESGKLMQFSASGARLNATGGIGDICSFASEEEYAMFHALCDVGPTKLNAVKRAFNMLPRSGSLKRFLKRCDDRIVVENGVIAASRTVVRRYYGPDSGIFFEVDPAVVETIDSARQCLLTVVNRRLDRRTLQADEWDFLEVVRHVVMNAFLGEYRSELIPKDSNHVIREMIEREKYQAGVAAPQPQRGLQMGRARPSGDRPLGSGPRQVSSSGSQSNGYTESKRKGLARGKVGGPSRGVRDSTVIHADAVQAGDDTSQRDRPREMQQSSSRRPQFRQANGNHQHGQQQKQQQQRQKQRVQQQQQQQQRQQQQQHPSAASSDMVAIGSGRTSTSDDSAMVPCDIDGEEHVDPRLAAKRRRRKERRKRERQQKKAGRRPSGVDMQSDASAGMSRAPATVSSEAMCE